MAEELCNVVILRKLQTKNSVYVSILRSGKHSNFNSSEAKIIMKNKYYYVIYIRFKHQMFFDGSDIEKKNKIKCCFQ